MYAKNIMLVDDDRVMLELVAHILEEIVSGKIFSFSSSTNALSFFKRIDREPVDLIISDWFMPEMDGMAFLRAIRMVDKKKPFLMLTGNASKELVLSAKQAGTTDFIIKPFNDVDLAEKVKMLLRADTSD